MTMKIAPGDAVLTKFGTGVVVRCFSSSSSSSSSSTLPTSCSRDGDDKKLLNDNDYNEHPTSSSLSSSVEVELPGNSEKKKVWATVRLWRRPGQSIASCAIATLLLDDENYDEDDDDDDHHHDDGSSRLRVVQKKLVAAPGMIVRACNNNEDENSIIFHGNNEENVKEQQVDDNSQLYLIEQYLPATNVYVASLLRDNDVTTTTKNRAGSNNEECITLSPHQILQASSKFYPILQDLIDRGESAWNVAMERSNGIVQLRQPPEGELVEDYLSNKLSSVITLNTTSRDSNQVDDDEHENDGITKKLAKTVSDSSTSLIQTLQSTLGTAAAAATSMSTSATNESSSGTSSNSTTLSAEKGIMPPLPNNNHVAATTEEVKQIYNMLRDDELTQLFLKGQARLKELVEIDIPEETRQILKGVGIEFEDDDQEDYESLADEAGKCAAASKLASRKMDKLRKEALKTLTELLKTKITTDTDGNVIIHANDATNIQVNTNAILGGGGGDPSAPFSATTTTTTTATTTRIMEQTQEQFTQMFDQLSKAATSDPKLLQIFGSISEKTRVWQEMTGRLLQTRTASLFMEGGQRLRARAAEILTVGGENVREALAAREIIGSSSSTTASNAVLMRAFTEGDVAKAKLKSIEMGDAIRQRLFKAIELRSESSGGLDAIIAGSLMKLHRTADGYSSKVTSLLGLEGLSSEDSIQSMIANLQQSASSTMKGTKETLIALLSHRSGYRDSVLLRLERTFLDLESQLGKDLSAEQIADISRGEGGSMALFEPIAMKAAKEIDVQLDAAEEKMRESKHWNSNAGDVMMKVRQITRGELSMNDIIDMAAGYLDNEQVVASSGGLIVKAENLLDSFEAASARINGDRTSNKMPRGYDAATGLMDIAVKAGITKDAVMQGVDGLDMNKLLDHTQSAITDDVARRELISRAGDSALDFLLKILPSMPVPPFDGVRDGLVYHLSNLSMAGFKVKKEDITIEIAGIRASSAQTTTARAVKASELLVIDIRNISATLNDAVWSFEQTYMPYLKGSGKANTRLWDGAIRLKFELRRRIAKMEIDPVTGQRVPTWEPVLCLNDRSCSIGGVDLTVQGEGRITWVANKLASLLGTKLRDYVVNVIINALTNNIGRLIDMLNSNLCNYWDLIMRTANLELDKLPELAAHHVINVEVDETDDEVELVWRERLPLGLNILTNDKSGWLKVIDLPRGTQARMVAQSSQLDPDLFKGSTIISVNGRRYGPETRVELFAALKDPARPKAILFKLASRNDVVRMEKMFNNAEATSSAKSDHQEDTSDLVTTVAIVDEGDIGLKLRSHDNFALSVVRYNQGADGRTNPVEKSGKVLVGDLLSHINGTLVLGENGEGKRKALSLLKEVGSKRPLSLSFVKPYKHHISLRKHESEYESFGGPLELVFTEVTLTTNANEKKMILSDFALTEGAAEKGGVFVGDNLVFINGIPVGAGCRFLKNSDPSPSLDHVIKMLKQYSPLALTFARAQAKKVSSVKTYLSSSPLSLDLETAHTFSIASPDYDYLGCSFVTGMNGSDIVVKQIRGVAGSFQREMKASGQSFLGCELESLDGEVVPSYANAQLIVSAMNRRWASNGQLELTFCNERQRDLLFTIK